MKKNIVILQFSSRNNGNCTGIASYIGKHYVNENVFIFVVDNKTVEACNNCNYECLTPEKRCPTINEKQTALMDAICNADIAYFIIPNYCGYPCANYFVFNERSVGYFNMDRALQQKYMRVPKRFVIVSNTESINFVNAVKHQVADMPEILYLKTSKYGKRSIAGDLMESDDAKADIYKFLV